MDARATRQHAMAKAGAAHIFIKMAEVEVARRPKPRIAMEVCSEVLELIPGSRTLHIQMRQIIKKSAVNKLGLCLG